MGWAFGGECICTCMYRYVHVYVWLGPFAVHLKTITLFVNWLNPNPKNGFPDSSVDKEFACNPGDPGSIPGSGRSAGEGIGYPLQYSSASPVAQLVKNLTTMRETWVQSLGLEDPLKKGKTTHSSILAQRMPWIV